MADTAASVVKPFVKAGIGKARETIVAWNKDHYDLDKIKKMTVDLLQQIKDDMEVLLNKDFKTARDKLVSWQQSDEPIESQINRERIRVISEKAADAFNTVPDPLDKLTAAFMIVFADYHQTALADESSPPNWLAGKREAQKVLKQYTDELNPQLISAAKEELGRSMRSRVFRNKDKCRKVLQSYVTLYYTVFELAPISANSSHPPHFEQVEVAATKMISSRSAYEYISPKICHVLSQPMLGTTLKGHNSLVTCCAVYANGTRAISGSFDKTLRVWNLTNGMGLYTLEGHKHWVRCCAVFANDTQAISGSEDKTLKVWDLTNGAELYTLQGHVSWFSCAVFANGTRALSGGVEDTLKVWDLLNRKEEYTLEGHTSAVRCCAVFANDTRAISGGTGETLKLWDLTNAQEIYTLEGHGSCVTCCAVYANGSLAISGSADTSLRVWDLTNCQEIYDLEGLTSKVCCCAVYGNDTWVICGCGDGTLKVWDLTNGRELCSIEGHTSLVNCCAMFANGSRVISGSSDGTLKVWLLPSSLPHE